MSINVKYINVINIICFCVYLLLYWFPNLITFPFNFYLKWKNRGQMSIWFQTPVSRSESNHIKSLKSKQTKKIYFRFKDMQILKCLHISFTVVNREIPSCHGVMNTVCPGCKNTDSKMLAERNKSFLSWQNKSFLSSEDFLLTPFIQH